MGEIGSTSRHETGTNSRSRLRARGAGRGRAPVGKSAGLVEGRYSESTYNGSIFHLRINPRRPATGRGRGRRRPRGFASRPARPGRVASGRRPSGRRPGRGHVSSVRASRRGGVGPRGHPSSRSTRSANGRPARFRASRGPVGAAWSWPSRRVAAGRSLYRSRPAPRSKRHRSGAHPPGPRPIAARPRTPRHKAGPTSRASRFRRRSRRDRAAP